MILFFLLFLVAPICFAEDAPSATETVPVEAAPTQEARRPKVLLAIGIGAFLEEDGIDEQYFARVPGMVRGGWILEKGEVYYEYNRFSVTTGEGAVTIRRIQHMQLVWYRHRLQTKKSVIPFLAGGIGAQANSLKTEFGSQTIKSNGVNYLMGALATGAFIPFANIFEGGLEVRLLASETFRPNLTIGAMAFIGVRL